VGSRSGGPESTCVLLGGTPRTGLSVEELQRVEKRDDGDCGRQRPVENTVEPLNATNCSAVINSQRHASREQRHARGGA